MRSREEIFLRTVVRMREQQRQFFKTSPQDPAHIEALRQARALEKKVDAQAAILLAEIEAGQEAMPL